MAAAKARKLRKKRSMDIRFPKQVYEKKVTEVYDIGDVLGEGAFSIVKVGKVKEKPEEQWAIKIVNKRNTNATQMKEEIEVMAQLDHPNLVKYKEIYNTYNDYYVVLEFISGGELFDRIIKLHRYTEKHAAETILDALRGIDHMHSKGMAHRDIKPENLLLASPADDAPVKIADFGFTAKLEGNDSSFKEFMGSVPYMAPELANLYETSKGKTGYGRPVDIWAIGVIMYILLSGIHPFQMDDDDETVDAILESEELPWYGKHWDAISANGKDLLTKMLAADPAKRITATEALKHPWFEIVPKKHDEVPEVPKGVSEELRKFQMRRKFKGAVNAVRVVNKMKHLTLGVMAAAGKDTDSDADWTLADLRVRPVPSELDKTKLETYLSDKDFKDVFGMDKAAFSKLKPWQQKKLKQEQRLHCE